MTRSAIEIIQDATQSTRDALVKPFSQRLDELVAQHPAQVANRASYDRQVANAFVARTTCRIAVKGAPPIPAGDDGPGLGGDGVWPAGDPDLAPLERRPDPDLGR